MGDKDVFSLISDGAVDELRSRLEADPGQAAARNSMGLSAVLWAKYHGRQDLVELVVAAQPALDCFDLSALGHADALRQALGEDTELVRLRSADGFTALHLACFFGHPDAVRLLLAAGADADANAEGATAVRPLHSAAAARSSEIVDLLLAAGVDVDSRQQGGFTALQAAAKSGLPDMVRALRAAGADAGLRNDAGHTAADLAAEAGNSEIVELLG